MGRMIIIQGIPGSGKSTHASELCGHFQFDHTPCEVVSADHYMVDADGDFCFDPSRLAECHGKAFRKAIEWMREHSFGVVVVDNCNTRNEDVAPWALLAQAFGWPVDIVRMCCDRETAIRRGTHNVPSHTVSRHDMNLREFRRRPEWGYEEIWTYEFEEKSQ